MPKLPRLEAIIEDRTGSTLAEGPLANIPHLYYRRGLNELGAFETLLPLRDKRVDHVAAKTTRLRFQWNGVDVFTGVVEQVGVTVENDGALYVPVSGRCHGADLAEASIGFLSIDNGAGAGVSDGPQDVLDEANAAPAMPNTWTLDTTDGSATTDTTTYSKFAGESAVAALRKIGEKIGEHFRIHETDNKVVWLKTATPVSGIRAIQGAPDMVAAESNPLICFFETFEEMTDAHDLITRIYPYGGGRLEIAPTLVNTTKSAPAGYTLTAASNVIIRDAAEATEIGHAIPRYVQFPDIRPISNTDPDVASASDALFEAALAYLQAHDTVSDFKTYKLGSIVQLPTDVKIGTTINVLYTDERYNVDEDFVVLEIETNIRADASKIHSLLVAQVNRFPASSLRNMETQLEDGSVFQTHPVIGPSLTVIGFGPDEFSGTDSKTVTVPFWLNSSITSIQSVFLFFKVDALRSTVVSVVGGASSKSSADAGGSSTPTSATGGGTTETVTSGGASSPTSGTGNHVHPLNIPSGTITDNIGLDAGGGIVNATGSTASPSTEFETGTHSHTVTIAAHGHTVPMSNHQHVVTISSHQHGMAHTHESSETYGIWEDSGANVVRVDDNTGAGYIANMLADMTIAVNGTNLVAADITRTASGGDTWFKADLTGTIGSGPTLKVVDSAANGYRPIQEFNTLTFAGVGDHKGRVTVQIYLQPLIQAIAVS